MSLKICILYSEVMPYTLSVIKQIKLQRNCQIFLVHWDYNKKTPFSFDDTFFDKVVARSKITFIDLIRQLDEFNPNVLWVSCRMDKLYLKICRRYKKHIPVVMATDDQWTGAIKDYLKKLISIFLYKQYFNHCWVPGISQYIYCRKMGFSNNVIVNDLYSASSIFFNQEVLSLDSKRFLFVGRFTSVKNIRNLISSFKSIPFALRNGWKLRLVGSGSILKYLNKEDSDIEIFNFEDQVKLIDHAKNSSIFILPSIHEPWGVVVHEFAALGMPLLLSSSVGSSRMFLIDGFNGFSFNCNSTGDLRKTMLKFISLDLPSLREFGTRSKILAKRITPELSAANFLSIVNK